MNTFGFLFDEHIAPPLWEQLAILEPELRLHAVGLGNAPPKSTPDPGLLRWIEANNCLLVTNNRSTMPVHLPEHLIRGGHIPGIVQLPRHYEVGTILAELHLIWGAGEPDEFRDRITYLPLR